MGIVNRDGALYMAAGIDNSGLYSGRREAMGIIKAMAGQITSFDVFSGIGISAATAFASAAKSSYDFEKEFQKNMLEVATISTQVTDDMTGFMNQVMAITQQIPIKAPEAAKALYQIVSAGHDGAAGMKILEVSAKSAVGGLTDTATAADAITTVLNAYKMSADEASNISDQLFTTVRLGKTTFGELGRSIAQVAPIAASYGVEIDQVLAAVASLTKQGTPTAQAMTQIRAAIIGTSKVLGDGAFASRTFQEALAEVATRANGSESKLRELVPEIEAVNGVLGMTGKNALAAASDLGEMQSAAGATEAAFGKMKDEVGNQMILLSNNIQAALRPMGQAILKEVSDIAKAFNDAFENGDVERALKSLGDLIVIVTGAFIGYKGAVTASTIAQNIHTKALVVSRLASMKHITTSQLMTNAIKAQTVALLKNVAALATNPYVLAAAAISALGYGIYKYATQASVAEKAQMKFNERLEEQSRLAEELKNKTEQLLDSVKDETKTDYERNKALKALKDLYPQIFEKYDIEALKLADLLKIKKEIAEIDGQRSFQSDKSYYANLVSKRDKLNAEISYRSENYGNGQYKYGQFYGKTVNELKKEREGIQHEIDLMYSGLQDQAEEIWNRFTPKEVKIVSLEKNIKALEEEKAEIEARIKDKENKGLFVDALDLAKLASVNKELTITNEKIISLNKTISESEKKDSSSISKEISDVTKKISTLKQELADLRSGKTTVEAGKTVQAVIEEKVKELKTAEDSLATLTGIDKKGSESLKKTKQEQADLLLEISRNAKERENAERQTAFDIEQAKIDIMKEGYEKEQSQIDLNHQKALQSVKSRGEEMLKAQQDAERRQWEKDGKKGVFTPKIISVSQLPVEQLQLLAELMDGIVAKTDNDSRLLFENMLKKYQTYEEKRKEIAQTFDKEISKMQEENTDGKYDANIKEAEKLKNKALSDLDSSVIANKSMWSRLFSDTSAMSKRQLQSVIADIKKLTDYLEGVDLTIPVGFTEEQLKSLKEDPEKIKAIYDELIKKQQDFDDRTNYPLSGFTKGFNKLKESADLARKAVKATTEEEKRSLEYQAEAVKAKGMQYIADGAVEAADGVSFLADKLAELAKATGDERLSETAEQFGAIAQNFAAAGKGFQSGGWIGAIIGGATDMITQTFSAFATAKAEAKEFEDNRRDFLNEYNLLQLKNRMSAEDQDNVFGTSALKRASEAAKAAEDAMAQYTEEVTKRTAPELRKEFNSLGAAIFTGGMFGGWLGLGKRMSNESKVLIESYKKGYTDLQSMAVKTRDYSGWANFWGKKDKYTSLKDLAPQLWDQETGDFDIDSAKAFLETNTQINDEQRKQIQNVIDLKEAYDEAMQVLKDDISDTFGSLGSGMLDSIVAAVQNGDVAIDKFADSVGKTFENLGKKIMQELFFQSEFDKLQEDLLKTYNLSDSSAIANAQMDIVSRFFDSIGGKMDEAEIWLEEWKKKASEKGFSIFGEEETDWLGTTRDTLAQSILDGIRSGKTGIKEFSSDFEDAMKTAVMNSIKMQYLETPLKEFYKKFASFSESGGQLTAAEIEELRGMYNDIVTGAMSQFDAIKEISGLDFSDTSDNSLKGAYAKASQESIDLLAGQTGAQRVAIESIRDQLQFIRDLQIQGWRDVSSIKDLVGQLKDITNRIYDVVDDIKENTGEMSEHSERTLNAVEGTLNVKVKMT